MITLAQIYGPARTGAAQTSEVMEWANQSAEHAKVLSDLLAVANAGLEHLGSAVALAKIIEESLNSEGSGGSLAPQKRK
jgi:hypothetical protein